MRQATALAAVVFALACSTCAIADLPETISYQTVLRDSVGNTVPDGTYEFDFRIYLSPTTSTVIWFESQTLVVQNGIVNARLGAWTGFSNLDFQSPYWLGISVDHEDELVPRTELQMVPYAVHAATADTAFTDEDWLRNGDDVHKIVGNVGIGQTPSDARLDVEGLDIIAADFGNYSASNPAVRGYNFSGTGAMFFAKTGSGYVPAIPAAVYGFGSGSSRGGHFISDSQEALRAESEGGYPAVVGEANGSGYAGQFLGGAGIAVQNEAWVGGFRMEGGAGAGYVLTSDATGVASWQLPAAAPDADWTVAGSDMYSSPSGGVGIGISTPGAKLHVEGAALAEALEVTHAGSPSRMFNVERLSVPANNNDILQIAVPTGSPDNFQYIECERGAVPQFQVQGDGDIVSNGGADFSGEVLIDGQLYADYYGDRVAEFTTTYMAEDAHIVHAECTASGSFVDGVAVYGRYVPAAGFGLGGEFVGGAMGVEGRVEASGGASAHIGVGGWGEGSTSSNYGVSAVGRGGTTAYGIVASATAATGSNYAGWFSGDVHVNGDFSSNNKFFRIDHPLDPANKYLQHACVESDEVTNVYSGNVVLDAGGKAAVQLPDWFEALNGDFRYQLTAIGGSAPGLHVSEEISGNSFAVAGGEPGMKVSWMVTGVRQDAYSNEHRLTVELDKLPHEAGKFLHPELHGAPKTAAMDYREEQVTGSGGGVTARAPREEYNPSDGE